MAALVLTLPPIGNESSSVDKKTYNALSSMRIACSKELRECLLGEEWADGRVCQQSIFGEEENWSAWLTY